MPYYANIRKVNALVQDKKLVGDGQCVSLIHAVTVAPGASVWHQGEHVAGSKGILPGTIIATFDSNGRYGNHTDGTSHAAIYIGQTPSGIIVIDQWKGHGARPDHVPQQRTIHIDGQSRMAVDKGINYYVVQ
jgi:hypothetical protein